MSKPQGHIDYQILLRDAAEGIRYASFEDYYARRIIARGEQLFPEKPTGALKAVAEAVIANVRECWQQFAKDHPDLIALSADGIANGCGGSPQAGEACQRGMLE